MKENKLPIKRYRAGAISVTVFQNGREINGKDFEFCSFQLQRRYKDKDGAWNNTSSMRLNDLPKAELLLRKAFEDAVVKNGNDTSDIEEEVI